MPATLWDGRNRPGCACSDVALNANCLPLKSIISFQEIGEAARDKIAAAIITKSQVRLLFFF